MVTSLIVWLDNLCPKTEVGPSKGMLPVKNLLQQVLMMRKNKQMALSLRKLLNGLKVQKIFRFKPECHGILWVLLMCEVSVEEK